MPELPDVEVFRKYLDKMALHQSIEKVEVFAKDILNNISQKQLQSQLEGRQFESTARHGKYLFANLGDNSWIVFHFGMTGYFDYFKDGDRAPRHTRALFSFDNGYYLAFVLQRKLGKITLAKDIDSFLKKQGLGPDALDGNFDVKTFKEAMKGTKRNIKPALMNQERMAGIGNIYADEILFQARQNPKIEAGKLSDQELEKLFRKTKEVLRTAIDSQANPEKMPEHYLLSHREKGSKCPVCGGNLKSEKISGRTSYYCPDCQR
jgi:formamidopyrimidine-DNA glycosylase